jgi:hypothetical protein
VAFQPSSAGGPCENPGFAGKPFAGAGFTMDIERINLIGTTLADLQARTDALRGYL